MPYYDHCPRCGARGTNSIYQCNICKHIFCQACGRKRIERGEDVFIFFKRTDTIHYGCPYCNSENVSCIGTVDY